MSEIRKGITPKQAHAIRTMGAGIEAATKARDAYVAGVLGAFSDVPPSVSWVIGEDDTLTLSTPEPAE